MLWPCKLDSYVTCVIAESLTKHQYVLHVGGYHGVGTYRYIPFWKALYLFKCVHVTSVGSNQPNLFVFGA